MRLGATTGRAISLSMLGEIVKEPGKLRSVVGHLRPFEHAPVTSAIARKLTIACAAMSDAVGQSRLTRSGMVCLARPGADTAKEVGVRNGAPHVADDQREGNIPARTDITTLRAVAAGH